MRAREVVLGLAACIVALGALGVGALLQQAGQRGSPELAREMPALDALSTTTTTAVADRSGEASREQPSLPAHQELKAALDAVWGRTPAGCLSVAESAGVIYEANATQAVAPASAIKVLTAAAALDLLGRDTVLTTQIRSGTPDASGRVGGDLWIVGGGDPVLGTTEWARATERTDSFTSLEILADRVVAAGVTSIEGRVVGDESRYDSARHVDSWPDRFLDDGEAGPLSALTVNGGFREWGHPGVPFDDPPLAAAELFTALLGQRGVQVGAAPAKGAVSSQAIAIATVGSPAVGDVVERMLRRSENGVAELLVKEMGLNSVGLGSTAAGVRAVAASLERRGLPTSGSRIADGSGLSDDDRVSCRLLTAVIAAGQDDLIAGLPVAGRDGTLKRRFVGTPVAGRLRAKTGSLHGVAALTGTVSTEAGNSLFFTYIVNGLGHDDSGRRLQDALATALVTAG